MKILKFGGSSLANGAGLENSLSIIEKAAKEKIAVVVSARGRSTDQLEELLEMAAAGKDFKAQLKAFFDYQKSGRSKP